MSYHTLLDLAQWLIIALMARKIWDIALSASWRTTFFGKTRHGLILYLIVGEKIVRLATFDWRPKKSIPDYPYIRHRGEAKQWASPRTLRLTFGNKIPTE